MNTFLQAWCFSCNVLFVRLPSSKLNNSTNWEQASDEATMQMLPSDNLNHLIPRSQHLCLNEQIHESASSSTWLKGLSRTAQTPEFYMLADLRVNTTWPLNGCLQNYVMLLSRVGAGCRYCSMTNSLLSRGSVSIYSRGLCYDCAAFHEACCRLLKHVFWTSRACVSINNLLSKYIQKPWWLITQSWLQAGQTL